MLKLSHTKKAQAPLVYPQALDSLQYHKKTHAKTTRSSSIGIVFKLSRFEDTVKENSFKYVL